MRNKNAQNNGKDGEYGEGKNEKEKTKENRRGGEIYAARRRAGLGAVAARPGTAPAGSAAAVPAGPGTAPAGSAAAVPAGPGAAPAGSAAANAALRTAVCGAGRKKQRRGQLG